MTNTPPILQPIEDAPEGVKLQLWTSQGRPHNKGQWYIKHTPDGEMCLWSSEAALSGLDQINSSATHFTLYPKPAKPKQSWESYVDREGSFATRASGGVGMGIFIPYDAYFTQKDKIQPAIDYLKSLLSRDATPKSKDKE